jgi:mannose-6-phosphate isomerase-like protein (cupin superfamily)
MAAGLMLVAPAGVPHGIRNTGGERLLVLAVLAPSPGRPG